MPGRPKEGRKSQVYKRKMADLTKGVSPKEDKKEEVKKEAKSEDKKEKSKDSKVDKIKKVFKTK